MKCPICQNEMEKHTYSRSGTVTEGLPLPKEEDLKDQWFNRQQGWRCNFCYESRDITIFPLKPAFWIFHDADGKFYWLQIDGSSGHWCHQYTVKRKGKLIGGYPIQ